VLGVEFSKEREDPKAVANGTVKLYCNDKALGQGKIRTQPGKFGLSGGGLLIGRMAADSVTKEYKAPFLWTGAEVKSVTFKVSGEHYRDLETEALAMLSRE
jgi:arylsulfatase